MDTDNPSNAVHPENASSIKAFVNQQARALIDKAELLFGPTVPGWKFIGVEIGDPGGAAYSLPIYTKPAASHPYNA